MLYDVLVLLSDVLGSGVLWLYLFLSIHLSWMCVNEGLVWRKKEMRKEKQAFHKPPALWYYIDTKFS